MLCDVVRGTYQTPVPGAVQGVRAVREAQAGQLPEGHAKATVNKSLHIHAKDTRVELGTPEEILDKGVRRVLQGC
jgi:hypothetical protein